MEFAFTGITCAADFFTVTLLHLSYCLTVVLVWVLRCRGFFYSVSGLACMHLYFPYFESTYFDSLSVYLFVYSVP